MRNAYMQAHHNLVIHAHNHRHNHMHLDVHMNLDVYAYLDEYLDVECASRSTYPRREYDLVRRYSRDRSRRT